MKKKKEVVDFLGNQIEVKDRAIRVHSSGHMKSFKRVTIECINLSRIHGDYIGIITDGNEKMGWTYPDRLITEKSFSVEI